MGPLRWKFKPICISVIIFFDFRAFSDENVFLSNLVIENIKGLYPEIEEEDIRSMLNLFYCLISVQYFLGQYIMPK